MRTNIFFDARIMKINHSKQNQQNLFTFAAHFLYFSRRQKAQFECRPLLRAAPYLPLNPQAAPFAPTKATCPN